MAKPGRRSGAWTVDLDLLVATLTSRATPDPSPLPTTRELAARYRVANSTVFRQMEKHERAGLLWRAASGRFHDARARRLIDKPRPIACLLRRIEHWSFLYQELMEGVAGACEEERRATLLWHDESLVRHRDVGQAPQFSSWSSQQRSLESFLARYGDSVGGMIFDHAWTDKALLKLPKPVRKNSVLLCRPAPRGMTSVFPDMKKNAGLALTRLLAAGATAIHPVSPFAGDPAVEFTLASIRNAADAASCPLGKVLPADTARRRKTLLQRIEASGKPVGLLVPEDNIACLLHEECRSRNLQHPMVMALQGTRLAAHIPSFRQDYAAIGREAVFSILRQQRLRDSLSIGEG